MIFTKYKIIVQAFFVGVLFISCSGNNELQWHQEQGYRWAEVSPGYFGETGFQKLDASATNIQFINHISEERISQNRNYLNGSGVAAADVDGDGLVDLYFAQLEGPNKLYKNMGGMEFRDITEQAGAAHQGYFSSGVAFADVDGDGDPDLLITSMTESNELYINDGTGNFSLKEDSGLRQSLGSNTMALADVDGDGDLDLYVTNYKLKTARDIFSVEELSSENTMRRQGDSLVVLPPYDEYYNIIKTDGKSYRNEYGESDALYLNDGSGNFEKAQGQKHFLDEDGNPMGLPRDWGLTARFQDINSDGHPDLYVANDFWTPDRFWINQGNGIFRHVPRNTIRTMSYSSMGVDFSDINRDGSLDFFVSEMLSSDHQRQKRQYSEYLDPIDGVPQYNQNSLYLNRGDNTFAEISHYANVEATEWSWATSFLDVDLDGYEDLVIATGHAYDYQDIDTQMEMGQQAGQSMGGAGNLLQYPELNLPNKAVKNNSDLTFTDKSREWGFEEADISLGMTIADLDNDGDPDLAMNRLRQQATVYENQAVAPRIEVRLEGESPNTLGIGANVELHGAGPVQQKEVVAGGNYVSSLQPAVFFAADEQRSDHQIVVNWPDGTQSNIDSVQANRIYVVEASSAEQGQSNQGEESMAPASTVFADESERLSHTHHEDQYTDTNVQPMLPLKVSEQGPGISWIDFDRDGDDDLFIASGKGSSTAVFENDGNGNLNRINPTAMTGQAPGDQTTILGWTEETENGNPSTQVFVGSANFEQGNPRTPSARHYRFSEQEAFESLSNIPGILSTTGPMAAADIDADGDIDLFVGGSYNPANYPRDASSRIFLNEQGHFRLDRSNGDLLSELGLISGATFTDYDRDGDPDLLIARQWDSLVLLQNNNGRFRDVSASVSLNSRKGWWNGITTGDFNNDGRPDIVATNIGKNSVYQLDQDGEQSHPLKLFYSDFNMDGPVDIVDSYYSPELQTYVPRRKLYSFDSLPSILRNVRSHEQYATSSLNEIFGQDFNKIPSKEINTVQHMLFLNTSDGFEAQPLPNYAQFSAVFHAGVADFNSDGNEDLFLSQNLFPFPTYITRQDAGRGLLLYGDGSGDFKVIKGQESGIKVYGEQRGASVSDFDGDGKPDLAVTQNEGATKLYVNQSERSGIRVSLVGPPSNRDAIGSAVRLVYENGTKGPLRELQAGSGYWSQHSFTQVLGYQSEPTAVEVHWSDGTSEIAQLNGGRSIEIIHN
ncbi:FG-GAP-like repeat-containing protein [Aliifodinibius sp. S!AR15-10]|uniref:FG-GAP-like repeat-containing protein n=1 Tax=Aliifodinibius sp. S!AR15-10 TaxID=2950437 RepID=UPI0028648D95|nr:FG-GAP-like repeat-containing protein [Aliifodinibius sp. S!AR15-10]MDR8392423.1 FG-GAP-like repeat-containing protein [Aliifodinibius sp. S!AR15-10]